MVGPTSRESRGCHLLDPDTDSIAEVPGMLAFEGRLGHPRELSKNRRCAIPRMLDDAKDTGLRGRHTGEAISSALVR